MLARAHESRSEIAPVKWQCMRFDTANICTEREKSKSKRQKVEEKPARRGVTENRNRAELREAGRHCCLSFALDMQSLANPRLYPLRGRSDSPTRTPNTRARPAAQPAARTDATTANAFQIERCDAFSSPSALPQSSLPRLASPRSRVFVLSSCSLRDGCHRGCSSGTPGLRSPRNARCRIADCALVYLAKLRIALFVYPADKHVALLFSLFLLLCLSVSLSLFSNEFALFCFLSCLLPTFNLIISSCVKADSPRETAPRHILLFNANIAEEEAK